MLGYTKIYHPQHLTISAYDAANNLSAQSSPVSATTPAAVDTQAPSVPANLSATVVSCTQINLSWDASTDNVGVTGYNIYRNSVYFTSVTNTVYSDIGLTPNTDYGYAIAAYDAAGNISAQCQVVTGTTLADTTAPSVPTGLTGTAVSTTQINLSWWPSPDNVGVSGYKVYRNGTQIANIVGTLYNDTGLTPGTIYAYTVLAYDTAVIPPPSVLR